MSYNLSRCFSSKESKWTHLCSDSCGTYPENLSISKKTLKVFSKWRAQKRKGPSWSKRHWKSQDQWNLKFMQAIQLSIYVREYKMESLQRSARKSFRKHALSSIRELRMPMACPTSNPTPIKSLLIFKLLSLSMRNSKHSNSLISGLRLLCQILWIMPGSYLQLEQIIADKLCWSNT